MRLEGGAGGTDASFELAELVKLVDEGIDPKVNVDRSLSPDDLEEDSDKEAEEVVEIDALRECERRCLWPEFWPAGAMEGGMGLPSLKEFNLCLTTSSFAASKTVMVAVGFSASIFLKNERNLARRVIKEGLVSWRPQKGRGALLERQSDPGG